MIDTRPTIPSPIKPTMPTSGEHINKGRRLANMGKKWMESNEDGFREIYRFVKSLQTSHSFGRLHDRVAIHCMNHHIRMSDVPEIKFSNDLWTAIARYLVIFDPSLLNAPVRLRQSDLDFFGLWPISWMEVTCSTSKR